ncbi:MAG: hypothetical protein GY940_38560 [bacterium]|nr:hypothetical protein [bacterium]
MKTKKIENKLMLNKETIAHLNDYDMTQLKGARGGFVDEDEGAEPTCATDCFNTCSTCPTEL